IRSSDTVSTISICEEGGRYYCFNGNWINFYVPKNHIDAGMKWKFGRVEFEVLRRDVVAMLESSKDVWLIKADRLDHLGHVQVFYYSEEDGIIAIKDIDKKGGNIQFFVIVGKKGFLSQ